MHNKDNLSKKASRERLEAQEREAHKDRKVRRNIMKKVERLDQKDILDPDGLAYE